MKLAVIADIHGNIYALEAVLADIYKQGVDKTIANGDLVNRAPDNVSVLERLQEVGCTLILGNHDDLICKWVKKDPSLPQLWFEDPFWTATAWVAKQISESGTLKILQDLPMQYNIELNQTRLLITHGSPRHFREGYGKLLTEEEISEIVEFHPADIYIGSHTHIPMQRYWGKYLFLNTGAVGMPFNGDPRAQYLLLSLEKNKWKADFRAVSYNQMAALKSYKTTGFLQAGGLSAHIFYEELRISKVIYSKFWAWAETQAKPKNWQTWQSFSSAHSALFK